MTYRFATERDDHGDLAAGAVLRSAPGRPAFPVRLASEIFHRCRAHLSMAGRADPLALYDPCCGSGYLLATLAFLHRREIARVVASDVDPEAVALAERNLSLLSPAGMDARIAELAELHSRFGKASHAGAVESAIRLRARLADDHLPPVATDVFAADALDGEALRSRPELRGIDLVVTDVPYGRQTAWRASDAAAGDSPGAALLESLRAIVDPSSLVAVTTDKGQKVAHHAYERVEHFQLGKRRTLIFRPKG